MASHPFMEKQKKKNKKNKKKVKNIVVTIEKEKGKHSEKVPNNSLQFLLCGIASISGVIVFDNMWVSICKNQHFVGMSLTHSQSSSRSTRQCARSRSRE